MITLTNVSKTYGNSNIKAVDSQTWEVPDGKITGFIGPNGAGKSTTLKMITGIVTPDDGSIEINGHDIVKDPIAAKKQFGFVSDSPDKFLRLKGIEYLRFCADVYEVPEAQRRERIDMFASRVGLTDALSSRIMSYSHGMRQKLMVIGALLHNPSVWILDEPLTGLDPGSSFALKEMMREHAAAGNSVLFSTHILEIAERLCDYVAIINHGRIVFRGTLEQLRARYSGEMSLENIFLEMTSHA